MAIGRAVRTRWPVAVSLLLVAFAGLASAASLALSRPGTVDRTSIAAPAVFNSVTSSLFGRASRADIQVSRSALRPPDVAVQRAVKSRALRVRRQALTRGVTRTVAPPTPRALAASMLAGYGWGSDQFSCLDQLWISESDWNPYAENWSSGAYGIPQSLPPEKMASAGPDWRTNPATQIAWGLNYIRLSYGTPCSAWAFKLSNNWY